jgi:hypothetical protein
MRIFSLLGSLSSFEEPTDDEDDDLLTGCGGLEKNPFLLLLLELLLIYLSEFFKIILKF